jgi:dynein heavy chain
MLWRRTAKRIPKSKVLENRSGWALKEVIRINHKCMKLAETPTPSNLNLMLIRAPVPWKQQYLISREFLSHNHFATHQVSMEIRRLWTSK